MFNKLLQIIKNKPMLGWVLFFCCNGCFSLAWLPQSLYTWSHAYSPMQPEWYFLHWAYATELAKSSAWIKIWVKTGDKRGLKSKHLGKKYETRMAFINWPAMVTLWGTALCNGLRGSLGHKCWGCQIFKERRPDHGFCKHTQPATCWTCKSLDAREDTKRYGLGFAAASRKWVQR